MANLIGGIPPFPGANNNIVGTDNPDNIFGDPFTQGNPFGITAADAVLSAGVGGSDVLAGAEDGDQLIGDAWIMTGSAHGGADRLDGGGGGDALRGDASEMHDNAV